MIQLTKSVKEAVEQGYFVFRRKMSLPAKRNLRGYHNLQAQEKRPAVEVYLKSTFASISIDAMPPMTEKQSSKIATYLAEKDSRKTHPHIGPGRVNFMYADRIPLSDIKEVADHVASILREA